ncbi:AAA family ATPase [Catellatospora bangladeshensis]|uniref:AAA family ATPase n=1 Tax=Catellatospora bangladeshensis TaxID=310355 RepID=UPI00360A5F5B
MGHGKCIDSAHTNGARLVRAGRGSAAPGGPPAPLRGREREQQTVAALLAAAASGTGGALLLHGDLGSGKTALLRAAAATVPEGTCLLETTGLAEEADLPYAGLQGLLQPVTDRIALLPRCRRAC